MDVEKTPAPSCTCPSGDGSLRSPCPAHGELPAINLQHEALGFVLFPLSPAAVAPHVAEYIIGFDFDEVRDVYGERFAAFWQGLVGMFTGRPATAARPVTGTQLAAGQQAPDLATSEGGRRYIAEFFATELRRQDFADYISTRLAADFACALAQHLAAHRAGAKEPERRAPVQGYHGKTIPWRVHGLAWEAYARKYPGQDAEKIASRGGFAVQEMDAFLPGWRDMADGMPAPGIDPVQLRALAEEWKQLEYPFSYEGNQAQRATDACRADLLALIDQSDAAPGVTNG